MNHFVIPGHHDDRFSTSTVTTYTVGRKPLRLRFLIMPFCLALLGSYLTYHALQGERGYFAWGALSEKRADKDKELLALQSTNAELSPVLVYFQA